MLSRLPPEVRRQIWTIFYAENYPARILCHASEKPQPDSRERNRPPLSPRCDPVNTTLIYQINTKPPLICKAFYAEIWLVICNNAELHLTRDAGTTSHHDFAVLPPCQLDKIRHVYWYQAMAQWVRNEEPLAPLPLWGLPSLISATLCSRHCVLIEELPVCKHAAKLSQDYWAGRIRGESHDAQQVNNPSAFETPRSLVEEFRKVAETYHRMSVQEKEAQWIARPRPSELRDMLEQMTALGDDDAF